jgi:hypothetical protein
MRNFLISWQNSAGLAHNVSFADANGCKNTNSVRRLINTRNYRYRVEMNKCYGLALFIWKNVEPFSLSPPHPQTLLLVQPIVICFVCLVKYVHI